MRIFIALDFPELKDYLFEIQNQFKEFCKANFTKDCHLTLKFLGEISKERVEEIKEKLREIKFESFSLVFDKIGFFPSEKFIRVVWIGVKEDTKVKELKNEIDKNLSGFFDDKQFHPHITLARVKFIPDKEKFLEAAKNIKLSEKVCNVKEFKLMKSTLTSSGAIYECLESFPLEKPKVFK